MSRIKNVLMVRYVQQTTMGVRVCTFGVVNGGTAYNRILSSQDLDQILRVRFITFIADAHIHANDVATVDNKI